MVFLYVPTWIAAFLHRVYALHYTAYFDDAFFNINRCKVELVRTFMPVICVAMLAASAINWLRKKGAISTALCAGWGDGVVFAGLHRFCAYAGFSENVMEGTQGRSLGLWLMLCCCGAYYVIGLGKLNGRALTVLILICAGACAFLGILNGAGIDPLGFYKGIKKGQEETFLSTIGHFDFFGTYLIVMFGLASGGYVFGKKAVARMAAAICAIILALGMAVSRTDSALLGMNLVYLSIISQSGDDYVKMARAASLWSECFAVLPVARAIAAASVYKPQFTGLPLLLCETHAASILTAVLLVFAMLLGDAPPKRDAACWVEKFY